ncbi:MAG TPA: PilZ domain-containing protein [Thermodesulfovibrionales bacterium]|nr:PilZ domain-containing protein [Thermodesulfovibrionales bacterium]
MQEQRLYPRFSVDTMDIFGKIMFSNNVDIINISLGGALVALLKTNRKLDKGKHCALTVKDKDKVLTLQGTVIRSELIDSTEPPQGSLTVTVGIKFSYFSSKKLQELADFISSFASSQKQTVVTKDDIYKMSGGRVHTRFHIDAPESAILYYYDRYFVKKLSLSGMLIRSHRAPEIEDILPMEMTLPGNKAVVFLGRIANLFSVKEIEGGEDEAGVEFVNMSEENKERLEKFVASLHDTDISSS